MNEDKQIQSMVDFIDREAQEKVEELEQAAQEEYDTEKMRLVESEKAKVRADCEKKRKAAEVGQRVARANHMKTQRVRVMDERAKVLETLKDKVKAKILALVKDEKKYKALMADLLRQAATSVASDGDVLVRKVDEALAKNLLRDAEVAVEKALGKPIKLTLSKNYLEDSEAWGGLVVQTPDGRVVCNNTLALRMTHMFGEQLPTVRYILFDEHPQI